MSAPPPSKRRLLFVVNELYFFWSHRRMLALAAQRDGYEVHVAAPATHAWAPRDFDSASVRELGFATHVIPLNRRGRHPVEDARTALALYSLYRRIRPDIVHLLTIKPVLYGGVAARATGVPVIVAAVTGLGQAFVERGAAARGLRWALAIGYHLALRSHRTQVIVQNGEDGARIRAMTALPPRQVHLVRGSGVDLNEFAATPEPPGPPLVVLPSRLIWEKGILEFVEAARRLRHTGARFALVGDTVAGYPRAVPEEDLRRWQQEGVVEWWGRREDMPSILAAAAVVCLPSRYGEGVPRALIEAAAAGRPAVATDTPGCRDIVQNGINGLIVPPGDVDALVAALGELVGNRDLRQRMGRAGRQLVEQDFGLASVVAQTLGIYADAAAALTRP